MRTLALGLWMAVLLAASAGAEEGVKITGRVVTADGKPVANADVAPGWLAEGERMAPQNGVKADAEGKFEFTAPRIPFPLMAVTPDGKEGAFVAFDEGDSTSDVEFQVEPLVLVRGRLHLDDPDLSFGGGMALVVREGFGFAGCRTKTGEITLRLPVGEYSLVAMAEDAERLEKPLTIAAGADVDLGTLDLKPTLIAKSYGKAAPSVTAVDREGASMGLESLKGKWVLLEFWGFW